MGTAVVTPPPNIKGRSRSSLGARVGLSALLVLAVPVMRARAQDAESKRQPGIRLVQVVTKSASISAAATIIATPGSETRLTVEIKPSDDPPRNTFVRVRGLPQRLSLSDGHAIAPGTWAIPLFALANLKLAVPSGVEGRSDLTLALVDIDGNVISEARTALIYGVSALPAAPAIATVPVTAPAPERTPPPVAAEAPPAKPAPEPPAPQTAETARAGKAQVAALPAPAPAVKDDPTPVLPRLEVVPPPKAQPVPPPPQSAVRPPMSDETRARAQRLYDQGTKHLGDGNIAVARNYFSRAADLGHAASALRIAETYDPNTLAALNVRGVRPNAEEARNWYEKARDLGARDAEDRLRRLTSS